MKTRILLAALTLSLGAALRAQEITSPDGTLAVKRSPSGPLKFPGDGSWDLRAFADTPEPDAQPEKISAPRGHAVTTPPRHSIA